MFKYRRNVISAVRVVIRVRVYRGVFVIISPPDPGVRRTRPLCFFFPYLYRPDDRDTSRRGLIPLIELLTYLFKDYTEQTLQ